jgi:hypothetical protein
VVPVSDPPIPSEAELESLVGHRFAGGTHRIEGWENRLLTEATGAAPLPDGLAHPVHVFHGSLAGAGTGVADLLDLFAFGPGDSVVVVAYDWQFEAPLREGVDYRMSGGVTGVERRRKGERIADHLFFAIDVADESGTRVATAANEWRIARGSR